MNTVITWLVKAILDWIAEMVFSLYEERRLKAELDKKDAELLKQYEEIINAGDTLSRDERRRIAEHLLNA